MLQQARLLRPPFPFVFVATCTNGVTTAPKGEGEPVELSTSGRGNVGGDEQLSGEGAPKERN